MKYIVLLIVFLIAIATAAVVEDAEARFHRKLIWADDFDSPAINEDLWEIEVNCDGGGNQELQCYTNRTKNIRIENGMLVIEAHQEQYQGHNFTSGRMHMKDKTGWLFGRFEARVRIPEGKHLWPAVWMLPQHYTFGKWAASGEIDILESRGQNPTQMESTLHFGGEQPNNAWKGSGPQETKTNLARDFHVIALDWTEDEMVWTCDETEIHRQTLVRGFWSGKGINPYTDIRQPFNIPFNWVLNLAIGGPTTSYFGGYDPLTAKEAAAWRKTTFEVDYVHVYQ